MPSPAVLAKDIFMTLINISASQNPASPNPPILWKSKEISGLGSGLQQHFPWGGRALPLVPIRSLKRPFLSHLGLRFTSRPPFPRLCLSHALTLCLTQGLCLSLSV